MLYLRDLNRPALGRKRVGREYFKQRLKKKSAKAPFKPWFEQETERKPASEE